MAPGLLLQNRHLSNLAWQNPNCSGARQISRKSGREKASAMCGHGLQEITQNAPCLRAKSKGRAKAKLPFVFRSCSAKSQNTCVRFHDDPQILPVESSRKVDRSLGPKFASHLRGLGPGIGRLSNRTAWPLRAAARLASRSFTSFAQNRQQACRP